MILHGIVNPMLWSSLYFLLAPIMLDEKEVYTLFEDNFWHKTFEATEKSGRTWESVPLVPIRKEELFILFLLLNKKKDAFTKNKTTWHSVKHQSGHDEI